MSTVAQRIQNIAEQIQGGTVTDLQSGLRQIGSIPKQQLSANQTAITLPIQQLTEAVERNIKLNQTNMQNGAQVQRLVTKAAQNLPTNIRRQITPIIRNIETETRQASSATRIDRQIKNATDRIQRQIQRQAATQQDTLKQTVQIRSGQNSLTPIQQSVQLYAPMFRVPTPTITKPNQLPSTMRLLSLYTQLKGRKPVGSVTNKSGIAYVGIKSVDRGDGIMENVQYQQNQIQKSEIPSIPMQLQYHANRTINTWNNYISQESKFVNFFQKVNSTQSRLKFVEQSFKSMNINTYNAQIVATINFYYIYLPVQKMLNGRASTFYGSIEQNFKKNYKVGDSIKTNPLLLSNVSALELVKYLMQLDVTPVVAAQAMIQIIKKFSTQLNKKQILLIQKYVGTKQSQAKQFLMNNGLSQKLAGSVLINPDWSSVKKKKILINANLSNQQLINLAQDIITQSAVEAGVTKKILQTWTSPEILCHDYIFKWFNQ